MLPEGGAGAEMGDAGEGYVCSGGSSSPFPTLAPSPRTTDLCTETPESSTYASVRRAKQRRSARLGSRSDRAAARIDENTPPCPQAPSHAAAAGSPAHAERAGCGTSTKPRRRQRTSAKAPTGAAVGGRGGCLAQESRRAARASPPPRQDFQGADDMQASTKNPPPD